MRFGPIVLVWCMAVVAANAVFSTFLNGFGGSTHQNADGAHLLSFYGMFWIVLLCGSDLWRAVCGWGQLGV